MDPITLIATCAPMVAPATMQAIVAGDNRGDPSAIQDGKPPLFPATRD
jgi:hypothetical protein